MRVFGTAPKSLGPYFCVGLTGCTLYGRPPIPHDQSHPEVDSFADQGGSATQSLELAAASPAGEELSVTTRVHLEPMELIVHPPVR